MEELLLSADIEDISFHDIARQARTSPASVNYHFPTAAAMRIVLTERHMKMASDNLFMVLSDLISSRNGKWQNWLQKMGEAAVDYYNENRHITEVILGPASHRSASRAAIEENERIAEIFLQSLKKVFVVPDIPELTRRIKIAIEVADSLWSRAYLTSGHIDDQSRQEAVDIQVLYLRGILPETLGLLPLEQGQID